MNSQSPEGVPRLDVRGLAVFRSDVCLICDMHVCLSARAFVGLVGANGSGKTALLQGLAGLLPTRGDVRLDGQSVWFRTPREALSNGIALCPDNRDVFQRLTVEENLMVGGHTLSRDLRIERTRALLARFPELAVRSTVVSGQLSGGERQQLAIARSLMVAPRVLLLDEPSRGLSPGSLDALVTILREQIQGGMTVLVADQAADWLWPHVDRLLIMANGKFTDDIDPKRQTMDSVAAAYFDLRMG